MIKSSLFLLFPILLFAQKNKPSERNDFDQVILKMGLKDNDVVTVYTQFKVDNTGKIYDIHTRGEYKIFEEKANHILTDIPEITAAKITKNPPNTKIVIPLRFIIKTKNDKKVLLLLKEK